MNTDIVIRDILLVVLLTLSTGEGVKMLLFLQYLKRIRKHERGNNY